MFKKFCVFTLTILTFACSDVPLNSALENSNDGYEKSIDTLKEGEWYSNPRHCINEIGQDSYPFSLHSEKSFKAGAFLISNFKKTEVELPTNIEVPFCLQNMGSWKAYEYKEKFRQFIIFQFENGVLLKVTKDKYDFLFQYSQKEWKEMPLRKEL